MNDLISKKGLNSISLKRKIFKFLIRLTGFLIILIFLMIGVFWYIIENKKDWIIEEIQNFVNENNSGELFISDIDFLPLKHFPKAGIKLNNVRFYEEKDSLRKEDEPPFFKAKQIDANIDLQALVLSSKLKVDDINLNDISLNVNKEGYGSLNFSEAISLLTEKIQKQIEEFEINFLELSGNEKNGKSENIPNISFTINQLLYKNKKFENIEDFEIKGQIYERDKVTHIDISTGRIKMPYGSISLSAKSLITSEDELKVDTELKINDFPYNYVNNPIEEIVPFMDPTTKIWVLDSLAKFNLELNLSSLLEFQPFKVKNVNIINGKMDFIIVDKPKVEMDSISLHANNISFITNKKSNKIVGLKSLEGEMEIGKVKFFPINETEIKLSFSGMDNNIKIDFGLENNELTTQEGSVNLNLNNKEKSYAIQFIVKDIDIENLVNSKKKERISKGYIDLFVNLQTSGLKSVNLMNNLNGKVKFLSKEMILYGMDIDELLKAYEKTQKFNLVDVSAFLFAGPIGTVATKGSDLLKLSMVDLKENDSTSISNLIVDLKISNGQLTTEDVALATLKNRIAFMGSIDLVNDTIPNFTVVVLDKKGCSKIEQKFYGKTDDIQIAKVKTLQVVFGSVKNVVKSVFGKKCEPIYTGTIKQPSKKDKINKE